MKPFKLTPIYQDYLWGGTRLKTEFGKKTDLPLVAESWELSAYPAGSSVVATGELAGMSFYEFFRRFPEACGKHCCELERFPILIKLIDAKNDLSIQVHPHDEYARLHENESGKTEMWVVLQSEPGAFVYYGFNREITPKEVKRRIENDTLTEVLRVLPVRRGDTVFIPSGTVHAIGKGILLAEIQQNSNITYRMYDYGRVDKNGKPRPLRIKSALDVARCSPQNPAPPGRCDAALTSDYQLIRLAQCPYFTAEQLTLSGCCRLDPGDDSFTSLLCTEGDCSVECGGETLSVTKGESVFIPAGAGEVEMSGIGEFLLTSV